MSRASETSKGKDTEIAPSVKWELLRLLPSFIFIFFPPHIIVQYSNRLFFIRLHVCCLGPVKILAVCLWCLKQHTFVLSVLFEAVKLCLASSVWNSLHLCCQYCLKQRTFVLSVLSEAAYICVVSIVWSNVHFCLKQLTLVLSVLSEAPYMGIVSIVWSSLHLCCQYCLKQRTFLSCHYCLKQLTLVLSVLSEAPYMAIVSIAWSSLHLCCQYCRKERTFLSCQCCLKQRTFLSCQYCLKQRTWVLSVLPEAAYICVVSIVCSSILLLSELSEVAYICVVSIVWSNVRFRPVSIVCSSILLLSELSEAAHHLPCHLCLHQPSFCLLLLSQPVSTLAHLISQCYPRRHTFAWSELSEAAFSYIPSLAFTRFLSFTPAYLQRAVCPAGLYTLDTARTQSLFT